MQSAASRQALDSEAMRHTALIDKKLMRTITLRTITRCHRTSKFLAAQSSIHMWTVSSMQSGSVGVLPKHMSAWRLQINCKMIISASRGRPSACAKTVLDILSMPGPQNDYKDACCEAARGYAKDLCRCPAVPPRTQNQRFLKSHESLLLCLAPSAHSLAIRLKECCQS